MTNTAHLSATERTARFQARIAQKRVSATMRITERLGLAMPNLIGTKHRGWRLTALTAAFAIPAMAAAAEWKPFQTAEPVTQSLSVPALMPFERPGGSFPGSAFYYLENEPRVALDMSDTNLAVFNMSGTGDTAASEMAAARNAGPAARTFIASGDGISKARALQCLTNAVYYEAASEAVGGQRAVAQVVLNRVSHPNYPNSVCDVVFQGSKRKTGCQFSFTCDGSMLRTPGAGAWARAQRVAQDALSGTVYQPVGLATHYHTVWIYPYWAPSLHHIGTIGAHRFYKWKGSAGKPAAFTARYTANEAGLSVHAGSAGILVPSDQAVPNPVALQETHEETQTQNMAQTAAGTAREPASPAYSAQVEQRGGDALFRADNLPESSGVRPEYANSGRWITDPN